MIPFCSRFRFSKCMDTPEFCTMVSEHEALVRSHLHGLLHTSIQAAFREVPKCVYIYMLVHCIYKKATWEP